MYIKDHANMLTFPISSEYWDGLVSCICSSGAHLYSIVNPNVTDDWRLAISSRGTELALRE